MWNSPLLGSCQHSGAVLTSVPGPRDVAAEYITNDTRSTHQLPPRITPGGTTEQTSGEEEAWPPDPPGAVVGGRGHKGTRWW